MTRPIVARRVVSGGSWTGSGLVATVGGGGGLPPPAVDRLPGRQVVAARIKAALPAPSPAPTAGSTAMLANGTAAATSTMPMISRSATHPGAARIEPIASGIPRATRPPPAIASRPAAIAGATSGTTTRLTAGAITDRRPNDASTTGRVATWAARDTPRLSVSPPGRRPPDHRSRRSARGVAQAISPAVARLDSWNPASPISAGSETSRSVAAQHRAAAARPARPLSRANRTTPAMAPARRTDGEAPANAMYATIATTVTAERRRRPSPPAIAVTAAATIAMFQPEIATT
jgi:hypothetical protein